MLIFFKKSFSKKLSKNMIFKNKNEYSILLKKVLLLNNFTSLNKNYFKTAF